MEKAKIGIFDDREEIRYLLGTRLIAQGHEVVVEADSLGAAGQVISHLAPGDIDIALLDGNFSAGRLDSREGQIIARLLRAKLENTVRIINISGSDVPIEDADVQIPKDNFGAIQADIAAYQPNES